MEEPNERLAVTDEQLQAFQNVGKEFIKRHPDYSDLLDGATGQGFDFSRAATAEIIRLKRPDIAYFLAQRDNRELRAKIMSLKGQRAKEEVRRIASIIDRHGTFRVIEDKPDEVAAYLEQRREDIHSGKRRR